MIAYSETAIIQNAFRALADPTRRGILMYLSERDMSISDIVNNFDMTRAAVKKHLTILEEGGLISVYPKGRKRINQLEPLGLKAIDDWLQHFHQFWDESLSKLKHAVENEERRKKGKPAA